MKKKTITNSIPFLVFAYANVPRVVHFRKGKNRRNERAFTKVSQFFDHMRDHAPKHKVVFV